MKTLGLIGGTSWHSTIDYYRVINEEVNKRLGALHSAKLFLYSLDLESFRPSNDPAAWGSAADFLTDVAKRLETAGSDCIVICAATPHMVAHLIQPRINITIIHIAEVTAKEISKQKINTVGLLGTKLTMEQPFFKQHLTDNGINSLIPDEEVRDFIHDSIFNELAKGIVTAELKNKYLSIIQQLIDRGAQGIIFGCTEIPLLLKQEDCPIPVFDVALIHAKAAAEFALQE